MNWDMKQELANQYKKLGIFMSAHDLLKSVGIHEEAISCLFMAGRQFQAIEMAEKSCKKVNCGQKLQFDVSDWGDEG